MRERRAAHVRPRPPDSDRLDRGRATRTFAPQQDILRSHRPIRTGPRIPLPIGLALVCGGLVLGLITLTLGAGMMTGLIGGIAGAFNGAVTGLSSQRPATAPPSGGQLDTPVLDVPPSGGYTTQVSTPILGSVPGATVGKTGYAVHVYLVGNNDARTEIARVTVGTTTRFATPSFTFTEGPNKFVATLAGPNGEGSESPPVTYILDTKPPKITITSPAAGARVAASVIDVAGTSDAGATIFIRNAMAPGGANNSTVVGSDGKFKLSVPVVAGTNTINLTSTDQAGNATNASVSVKRDPGQLAAHLAVTPSKFASSSQTTLKLTIHATTFNGNPLAGAKATFTVTIQGLAPIVSPEMTTDATGTATWNVSVSQATPGIGQATVVVVSDAGDVTTANASITTT
jgi:hypothetical protein